MGIIITKKLDFLFRCTELVESNDFTYNNYDDTKLFQTTDNRVDIAAFTLHV